MKKNLTRLAALLLVFSMIFAFAACKGNDNDTDTETTTAAADEVDDTEAQSDNTVEGTEATSDDTTDVSEESTAAETETDASGNVIEPETDAPVANKKPSTTAEIVSYYNSAISNAVKAKVGFKKTRTTDNEKMDGSVGLQAMKGLVYKFMGIGAENAYIESVTKGNWGDVAFLYNSKLTTGDVTSANCTASGANYVITLKLKNGSSSASQSNPTTAANSSLDKCGICVGSEDKGYFDHKTASVIYDAIAGTYAGAEVKESYSNATVKATINASTGNIVSLVIEWNQSATLSKLLGMSATATGISHVTYKDFKY